MRVIGEILILFLLFLTNGRVLFVKHEKRDALVILSPVSLLLVILQICAWGLDVFNIYCLILAVLVLLSNFHALFRYSESLYVDHYSILMYFWAVVTSLLSIAGIIFSILFFPVTYSNKQLGIQEKKIVFEGSTRSGFVERSIFGKSNATMTIFSPVSSVAEEDQVEENSLPENPIIVFIADKRSETEFSKNYLQLLAAEGYTVCSTDFYTDDVKWLTTNSESKLFRRMILLYESLKDEREFELNHTKFTYNTTMELEALLPMLENQFGQANYFFISDEMGFLAVNLFANKHSDCIVDFLDLTAIKEYRTPGYGFVCQTSPLLAKNLGENRDSKGEDIKIVVKKTLEKLESIKKTEINVSADSDESNDIKGDEKSDA